MRGPHRGRGKKLENEKEATRRTHRLLRLWDFFVEGFLRVLDPHHRRLKLASHLQGTRAGLEVNVLGMFGFFPCGIPSTLQGRQTRRPPRSLSPNPISAIIHALSISVPAWEVRPWGGLCPHRPGHIPVSMPRAPA